MNTIVSLHGFTGEGADFEAIRAVLPSEARFNAPDLPGHGSRRHQRDLRDYSVEAHLALITEAATSPQVTLLGYSMGGRLALHWALAHPERVARLILNGASP